MGRTDRINAVRGALVESQEWVAYHEFVAKESYRLGATIRSIEEYLRVLMAMDYVEQASGARLNREREYSTTFIRAKPVTRAV